MSTSTMTPVVENLQQLGNGAILHFESALRKILRGPFLADDLRYFRFETGELHSHGNFVVLDDCPNHAALLDAISTLKATKCPSAVVTIQPLCDEIDAKLQAEGFEGKVQLRGMAIEIEHLAETPIPDGFELCRIDASEGAEWANTIAQGYPMPIGLARSFSPLAVSTSVSELTDTTYFAAKFEGRIAAVSAMHLCNGVAGIYFVATLEEFRGKGLGAFMTAAPLRLAKSHGYRVGILHASDMGMSTYRRLGFQDHGTATVYLRTPK